MSGQHVPAPAPAMWNAEAELVAPAEYLGLTEVKPSPASVPDA